MMVCPWCKYEWLSDTQIYEVELTKLIEGVKYEEENIPQYCARKRLEGWNNNRILASVVFKNKDNQKKAFMECIKVLRGENGDLISPNYWYFIKKYIIDKKRK
jgi:hypothetical protein